MDEQLDNDLRDHIREVFDNYEDASADEGWLLLREKFPAAESKRGAFAWVWWGAAAVVLAFLAVGLWTMNRSDKPENVIAKTPAHQQAEQKNAGSTGGVIPAVKPDSAAKHEQLIAQNQPDGRQTSHNRQTTGATQTQRLAQSPKKDTAGTMMVSAVDILRQNAPVAKSEVEKIKTPQPGARTELAMNTPVQPEKNTVSQLVANEQTKIAGETAPGQSLALAPKPKKTIMDMFNEDKGNPVKKDKGKDDQDNKAKKINFGLYATTYFNYGKGSDNEVNMGAGVTSDIKISRNLKLVTGVSVAQNSLSYQGVPTEMALAKSNLVARTPSMAPAATDFMALSTPTVRNYNASLVGLDIPLNIKYEFSPQKSDAYVLMGVSSGTFINESYTYKYNYPGLLSSSLQQTRDETTGNNFSGFYFAKTLNVAVGMGYPLGKNRLVIEPFLKYPLDGLGSQNLKFGAGGVNLKFNFLPSQKK